MKFYGSQHKFETDIEDYGTPPFDTEFTVVDEDSLTIAGQHVGGACILNFASHKRPGGGYEAVMNGPIPIRTQEEDLFRRSNLPELMDTEEIRDEHYPLMGIKALHCVATVHKDKLLQPCDPFTVGIITVPAVVNPSEAEGTPDFRSFKLVEAKIVRILEIASDCGCKTLILGAWGCGIFNNPPLTIAELFMKHLTTQFKGNFNKVIFGVPGENTDNHQIFKEVVLNDCDPA